MKGIVLLSQTGEEQGPFQVADLQDSVAAGKISTSMEARWADGMTWKPLAVLLREAQAESRGPKSKHFEGEGAFSGTAWLRQREMMEEGNPHVPRHDAEVEIGVEIAPGVVRTTSGGGARSGPASPAKAVHSLSENQQSSRSSKEIRANNDIRVSRNDRPVQDPKQSQVRQSQSERAMGASPEPASPGRPLADINGVSTKIQSNTDKKASGRSGVRRSLSRLPGEDAVGLTGNNYYDRGVFPRVARGEKIASQTCAIVPFFWLAWKGVWEPWVIVLLFGGIVPGVLWFIFTDYRLFAPVLLVAIFVWAGLTGNTYYYAKCLRSPPKKNVANGGGKHLRPFLQGIAGTVMFVGISVFPARYIGLSMQKNELKQIAEAALASYPDLAQVQVFRRGALKRAMPVILGTPKTKLTVEKLELKGVRGFLVVLKKPKSNHVLFFRYGNDKVLRFSSVESDGRECTFADDKAGEACLRKVIGAK